MKKALLLCSFFMLMALSSQAGAESAGPWHAGIHYGAVNNFKSFSDADTDAGSMVAVDYSYDFSDRYTVALELGYIVDNYVIPVSSASRYVETGTFLNIDHLFYLYKTDDFSPYYKLGTGIFAVTLWHKQDNDFYFSADNVFADIDAGIGADLKLWGILLNTDLTFPALAHEAFYTSKISYIFTIGYNYHF